MKIFIISAIFSQIIHQLKIFILEGGLFIFRGKSIKRYNNI